MATCLSCGATVGEDARYCSQCGQSPWTPASGREGIGWRIEIPLLTNGFIMGSLANAFLALLVIMLAIFGTIFAVANGWTGFLQATLMTLGLLAFFAVVTVFTLGLVLGNRYPLEFRVGAPGVEMISRSRRSHMANRLALLAGILARNPGVAGAGVAGMVTEIVGVAWDEVHRLRPVPDRQVIVLERRFFPDMHVFCLPENYEAVLSYMQGRVAPGAAS